MIVVANTKNNTCSSIVVVAEIVFIQTNRRANALCYLFGVLDIHLPSDPCYRLRLNVRHATQIRQLRIPSTLYLWNDFFTGLVVCSL